MIWFGQWTLDCACVWINWCENVNASPRPDRFSYFQWIQTISRKYSKIILEHCVREMPILTGQIPGVPIIKPQLIWKALNQEPHNSSPSPQRPTWHPSCSYPNKQQQTTASFVSGEQSKGWWWGQLKSRTCKLKKRKRRMRDPAIKHAETTEKQVNVTHCHGRRVENVSPLDSSSRGLTYLPVC